MISLQRLLGQENEFFGLLEQSADLGLQSIRALEALTGPTQPKTLDAFVSIRRLDKDVTNTLESKLITTFVTPIEREDLEALGEALYKIPKTVEKFAERYIIVEAKIREVDFALQIELMAKAAGIVLKMLKTMRGQGALADIKSMQNELQRTEAQADDVLLSAMQAFYVPGYSALKAIILHDLFGLNEKVIDRCRDAGNVISHVILKNS